LLWICKEFELPLADGIVKDIFRMSGSVCKLLALDLYYSDLTDEAPDAAILKSMTSEKVLTSADWLLCYEAGRRGWLGNSDTRFIDKHPYFGPMSKLGVEFYDEDAKLSPIFRFAHPGRPVGGFDFDSDGVIDKSFEFEDLEEEYSDSSKADDVEDSEASEEDDDSEEPEEF
jgi:hypothetical protein